MEFGPALRSQYPDARSCTEIDWFSESAQSVYEIRDFIEFKTTWHPIGA